MNRKLNLTIIISCVLIYSLGLNGCFKNTSPTHVLSQTLPATTSSARIVITATPTLNYTTVILTPEDAFSMPGLIEYSTPASEDFCEHLPPPQIVAEPNRISILAGRFALCIYEWTQTAMDMDTGSLVPTNDKGGDIVISNGRFGTEESPSYVVGAWNDAYINTTHVIEAYANHSGVNNLSYEYCENMLQGKTRPGGMRVEADGIACVKTTEGQIALLRVEKIYPAKTLSVEFSFAILRHE